MCFSKRRTKQIKLCILGTNTESVLLLMYLVFFLVSVDFTSNNPNLSLLILFKATLIQVNDMQSDFSMR